MFARSVLVAALLSSAVSALPAIKRDATPAPGSNPKIVPDETWSITDMIRYCSADNSGCDYNFDLTIGCETQHCTIIRNPGSNAATESWSNLKCNDKSDTTVSWGYVTEPGPPYVVITVNEGKQLAWFGIPNINGGKVTPSSPFGSGNFGDLPTSPVYEYN
ncbi:surface SP1 [Pyrenophora seminiperda CCB06]|uniref:Surface SP1 n=1 Tax=Pyrenophora seminiperda CCB06 TaxID=1302712 RepID=A0A3M7M536_9PLEO|nr:surface SP1 [Pyrenophora seminiperda CCB06]